MWGTGCASSLGRICVRVTLQIGLQNTLQSLVVNYNHAAPVFVTYVMVGSIIIIIIIL